MDAEQAMKKGSYWTSRSGTLAETVGLTGGGLTSALPSIGNGPGLLAGGGYLALVAVLYTQCATINCSLQ